MKSQVIHSLLSDFFLSLNKGIIRIDKMISSDLYVSQIYECFPANIEVYEPFHQESFLHWTTITQRRQQRQQLSRDYK